MFRTDAHNRTPASVAEEFANTYWDKPRTVINMEWSEEATYFQVVNGTHIFAITYCPAIPYETYATWIVSRP